MLAIRLQRMGKKKQPSYRLIVSEKHKDTQAGSLEILGHYNPLVEPSELVLKEERIKHWISVGAQPSNTVYNLLIKAGVVKGEKRKSVVITKKRQGKIDIKNTEKIQKEADAKAKAIAEKEAAKAAEEAEKEVAKAAAEEPVMEEVVEVPAEEVKTEAVDNETEKSE